MPAFTANHLMFFFFELLDVDSIVLHHHSEQQSVVIVTSMCVFGEVWGEEGVMNLTSAGRPATPPASLL